MGRNGYIVEREIRNIYLIKYGFLMKKFNVFAKYFVSYFAKKAAIKK